MVATEKSKSLNNISFLKWMSISLIGAQLLVKFYLELPKAAELLSTNPLVLETAGILTVVWIILLPLCVLNNRGAFLVGSIWGILHVVAGIATPASGTCNHIYFGPFVVGLHGLLITVFCFLAYKKLK
jgi:hypothetical protein